MAELITPKGYSSALSIRETEKAIKFIKDTFERNFADALNLERVSAPLFVRPESGLNDNLNGIERPVSFDIKSIQADVEIVQSLAKWKRLALKRYGFGVGEGLYTDMDAIRRDEDLDNLHSVYVDQWDWEMVISEEQRNTETLKAVVNKIVAALAKTEKQVIEKYPQVGCEINNEAHFITTQELFDKYPDLSPKEREDQIAKEYGTVFIMQIGGKLRDGNKHDGRSPDYDDWSLNGDIIVWNKVLNRAFELSSMGIRVNSQTLLSQLKEANCEDRLKLEFHKLLADNQLPQTMGGGIGQSRLCMLMLNKAHIGEVQSSVWQDEMFKACASAGINLL